MGMVINTNIPSLNAQRNLGKTQNALNKALQRLSSGLRINSAKDDAAGLALANRMTAQIRGLNQAIRNANDGISLAQTAEGALGETTNILQRMRELAVQSANASNTAEDRSSIQLEIDQLVAELNRIAITTTFNNKNILDGSSDIFKFQVGANANETISLDMVNVRANALGQQPGIVQSVGSRVSLANDAADTGTIGIHEGGTGASLTSGEFKVQVAGMSSVDIAQIKYGGTIGAIATASLKDVNHAEYGGGMAKDIAERINFIRGLQENDPITAGNYLLEGVYATAETTFKAADMDALDYSASTVAASNYTYVGAGSIANDGLIINGVDIGPVEFQDKDSDGSLTDAINAKSDVTGVKASINGTGDLVLTAEDGRDIIITTDSIETTNKLFGGGGNSVTGQDEFAAVFADLQITGAVTISAGDTLSFLGDTPIEAGFSTTLMTSENVQAVGSISNADVKTVESSNILIESVDSALRQVDDMRAKLGAAQNRLEYTIANLQNVSENLSASRSRTLDADFAVETANLTRAQIMQQAGVAMLAQANMLPQTVLTLLQ